MTYTIPNIRKEEVSKKLTALLKKAKKYGVELSWAFSKPYGKKIAVKGYDEANHCIYTKDTVLVEAVDVIINTDGVIKNGDYEVIAKIEHGENGNIVTAFDGEAQTEWATCSPYCQHCSSMRRRKLTFIVRSGDDMKQIGSSCLKDYCGIDPNDVGYLNQLQDIFDFGEVEWEREASRHAVYDTVEALALAYAIYKQNGYRASGETGSNKERLAWSLSENGHSNERDVEYAKAMAEYIAQMSMDDATKAGLNNIKVMLADGYCKPQMLGFVAYAPVAYERHIEREHRIAESKAHSQHIGEVGKRIEVNISEMKVATNWGNGFGTTYLVVMKDTDGNEIVWFSSKPTSTDWKSGKMTVKQHREYNGVRQTVVNRCQKVA